MPETVISGIIQQNSTSPCTYIQAGPGTYNFLNIINFKTAVDQGQIILSYTPFVAGTSSGPRAVWATTSQYYAADSLASNITQVLIAFMSNAYIILNPQTGTFTIYTTAQIPPPSSNPTTPQYSKVYVGHYATVTNNVFDLGGSKLSSIAEPVNAQDATSKSYVDAKFSSASTAATTALDAAKADLTAAYTAADATLTTSVQAVSARIDAILAGSDVSTDTLVEIANLAKALDAAESANLTSAVATIQSKLDTQAAALTAESATRLAVDTDLRLSSVVPFVVPFSASVYADAELPTPLPDSLAATSVPGWYYKNSGAGKKANWYMPNCNDLTVADLKNIYAVIQIINPSSIPFITGYTVPKSTGNAASWYNAKFNYDISAGSFTSGGKFALYTKTAPTNTPGFTPMAWEYSTAFSKGTALPEDKILAISIGTNSAVTVPGAVEFVLSKVGIQTPYGIREHIFSNADVALANAVSSLTTLTTKEASDNAALVTQLQAEITTARANEATLTNQLNALYQYLFGTSASVSPIR